MIPCYGRVSTEEQGTRGASLASQRELCERKARELGDSEALWFSDMVSGEHLHRPGLDALRDFIALHKPSHVICLDPDRLARKLAHQLVITEEIEKHGTELVYVQHNYQRNPEGQLFYSIRGAVSEYEKEKIKERMMRGRRQKLREGKLPYHVAIYGYFWVDGRLRINEEQSRWVRQIFAWAGEGKNVAYMVDDLNRIGIPTLKHTRWYSSTIRAMLHNTTYYGEMCANRYNWEGTTILAQIPKAQRTAAVKCTERPQEEWLIILVPPIVDKPTWETAQRLFRPLRRPPKVGAGMLSGISTCGLCGGAIHYVTNAANGYMLRCINKYPLRRESKRPRLKCKLPSVKYTLIESQVWGLVRTWLLNPDELQRYLNEQNVGVDPSISSRIEEEIVAYQEQLEAKRKEQVVTVQQMAKGNLDNAVAEGLLSDVKTQIENLTTALKHAESRSVGVTQTIRNADNLTESIQTLSAEFGGILDTLTAKQQKWVVRQLVKEVVLYPGRICRVFP